MTEDQIYAKVKAAGQGQGKAVLDALRGLKELSDEALVQLFLDEGVAHIASGVKGQIADGELKRRGLRPSVTKAIAKAQAELVGVTEKGY